MNLTVIDWALIIAFFVVSLSIGIWVARRNSKSSGEFFLSGRNMPWWLLGISMVATTFSADTPNLVTDIVRQNGVSGNWVWWAFLLTGMLTVFVYARLWRKSNFFTDLEFYEARYSGKEAAFLRGFRALYLGVFFNIMIMASVSIAAIKIGGVMLGLQPYETMLYASVVTVIYSSLGGFRGVLITDFIQFGMAMVGAIWAAKVALDLPQIGGLENLLAHENVSDKLDLIPDFSNSELLIPLFIMPLAVQWWSVWYPGAEPGGGGYVAQRMLAAKNEDHAVGATLLFNVAHYALRPWPWILIALCSLVIFPDLASLQAAFPNLDPSVVKNDLAYPAMLTFLPAGLLGLVIASLAAAFMSTISTHLNWGSSYIVNDFYKRFINPDASETRLVWIGRWSTVILMVLAALFALVLENALQAFNILLSIGAGTGLIFIMRWFWWRINAYAELTAMVVSFLVSVYLQIVHNKLGFETIPDHHQLLLSVAITTVAWVLVTYLTPQTDMGTLQNFYTSVKPVGPGWKKVTETMPDSKETDGPTSGQHSMATQILMMVLGCTAVYSLLFGFGFALYSNLVAMIAAFAVTLVSGILLRYFWRR